MTAERYEYAVFNMGTLHCENDYIFIFLYRKKKLMITLRKIRYSVTIKHLIYELLWMKKGIIWISFLSLLGDLGSWITYVILKPKTAVNKIQ